MRRWWEVGSVRAATQFLLFLRCEAPKNAVTVTVKNEAQLVVPPSVQRQAGIKTGDRLEFKVSSRSITIKALDPATYKPTKSELAAIRKGEAEIARGEDVPLSEFLHGLDAHRRKGGTKTRRKISR
jgi:bifunctional DNA-binding transcriptional regulator/antitoxin component of YhaV-PrlF toxin-antitoxin module